MLETQTSLIHFQRRFVQQALIAQTQSSLYPYRQTMVQSQVSALAASFPGFVMWVGSDCAEALFERYVRDCPSDSADLNLRGKGFSQWLSIFIKDLPAYQAFGFLPDYVLYEWYCECLKGAPSLQPSLGLEQLSESNVSSLRLKIQPCVQLLTSKWPLPALIKLLTETQTTTALSAPVQAQKAASGFVMSRQQRLNRVLDLTAHLTLKSIPLEEIATLKRCLHGGISIETAVDTLGAEQFQGYLTKWLANAWVYLIEV